MNCGVPVDRHRCRRTARGRDATAKRAILFPVGDVADMAASAVSLLADPARHELFRARARKRAEESFNADDIIPQYEAFYEELLRQ